MHMLYFVSLNHSPENCPGVANSVRDRVLRMSSTMDEVLQAHDCTFQGGWVSRSAHVSFVLIDGPSAHAVDDCMIGLGLAVWNTTTMYPVITLEEAVQGLTQQQ